jgi:hypothetical protein
MLFPGGHAASICDNTPEAICRVLEEEEGGNHLIVGGTGVLSMGVGIFDNDLW